MLEILLILFASCQNDCISISNSSYIGHHLDIFQCSQSFLFVDNSLFQNINNPENGGVISIKYDNFSSIIKATDFIFCSSSQKGGVLSLQSNIFLSQICCFNCFANTGQFLFLNDGTNIQINYTVLYQCYNISISSSESLSISGLLPDINNINISNSIMKGISAGISLLNFQELIFKENTFQKLKGSNIITINPERLTTTYQITKNNFVFLETTNLGIFQTKTSLIIENDIFLQNKANPYFIFDSSISIFLKNSYFDIDASEILSNQVINNDSHFNSQVILHSFSIGSHSCQVSISSFPKQGLNIVIIILSAVFCLVLIVCGIVLFFLSQTRKTSENTSSDLVQGFV